MGTNKRSLAEKNKQRPPKQDISSILGSVNVIIHDEEGQFKSLAVQPCGREGDVQASANLAVNATPEKRERERNWNNTRGTNVRMFSFAATRVPKLH